MYDKNWINQAILEIRKEPDYMLKKHGLRKPQTCYKVKLNVANSIIMRKIRQEQKKKTSHLLNIKKTEELVNPTQANADILRSLIKR